MSTLQLTQVRATRSLETASKAADTDPLDTKINDLKEQNESLYQSVETLLRLYEKEKAQHQSLQVKLDRLIENIETPAPALSLESMGNEIRKGVLEDLKPLLYTIIELLELSAPRTRASEESASEPSAIARKVITQDDTSIQQAPDDLPGALPEILTKSVEELIGKRVSERHKAIMNSKSKFHGKASAGKMDSAALENEPHTTFKGYRPHGWIPVTSDSLKR